MEKYTDLFMPELAELIWKGLYNKGVDPKEGGFLYIMLLFKQPAAVFPKSSNKLFFSTINKFVLDKREKMAIEIVDLFV